MIKANPSPNGNGLAFNLFGDPNVNYPNTAIVINNIFCFIIRVV